MIESTDNRVIKSQEFVMLKVRVDDLFDHIAELSHYRDVQNSKLNDMFAMIKHNRLIESAVFIQTIVLITIVVYFMAT